MSEFMKEMRKIEGEEKEERERVRLRDEFAKAALQGLTAGLTKDDVHEFGHGIRGGNLIASAAYVLADAMLKARKS